MNNQTNTLIQLKTPWAHARASILVIYRRQKTIAATVVGVDLSNNIDVMIQIIVQQDLKT